MKQLRATAWKNDEVIRRLEHHGFVITRKTKHIFLARPGKAGFVKVSMGTAKYVSLNAFSQMRHTSGLSREEFDALFSR